MKLKQLLLGATLSALTFGATANSAFEKPKMKEKQNLRMNKGLLNKPLFYGI